MTPLAERMRPQLLDDYVGQDHLTGPQGTLRKIVESGSLPSIILWGPPGVGKTTLAGILALNLDRPFYQLSAISNGVKDIREVIESARSQQFFGKGGAVLFIDEIHRFSKSQQDALLGAVEKGIVTLIGATTENPSFEVISALLSRCQIYTLKHLTADELRHMIDQAIIRDEWLRKRKIQVISYDAMIRICGGDGRKLYNILELVVQQFHDSEEISITDELVSEVIHQHLSLYDKSGEQHYDIISAFIKSVRASDPNAAIYYLARMIEGGEDPLFLCRRMVILASEDIGLANPNALLMANTCFQAVHQTGMPEGRIIMAQTAIYLACSPKSNSAYRAIDDALAYVRQHPNMPVPLKLRNAPTKLMKELGYGDEYAYAHQFKGNFTPMECLPQGMEGTAFYVPGDNPAEHRFAEMLEKWWGEKYLPKK